MAAIAPIVAAAALVLGLAACSESSETVTAAPTDSLAEDAPASRQDSGLCELLALFDQRRAETQAELDPRTAADTPASLADTLILQVVALEDIAREATDPVVIDAAHTLAEGVRAAADGLTGQDEPDRRAYLDGTGLNEALAAFATVDC